MRMTDKILMAMAVLMLAVVGFVAVAPSDAAEDGAVALDGTIAIDTDGTMTVTTQGEVEVDKAKMLALDLTDSYYIIPTNGMTTDLTIVTLAYYEAVKPYLTVKDDAEVFAISIAEVADAAAADWKALKNALVKLEVDVTQITTTIVTASPVAVAQAGAEAKDAAVAEVTGAKDAVIAEKDALIAEKDALIATMFTQEQLDQAVADALANVSDYQYTQADIDKAVDTAVAGVYAKYLTADQIKAVQDAIAEKSKELDKAVARMDMTQDEADKALADYTTKAYKDAIASETAAAKDKVIADLTEQLKNATKAEKPVYETGMGQCMIIIVVFLLALVVWFLFKQGTFSKLAGKIPTKRRGGSE